MNIYGLHHVTAVTAKIKQNLDFYTNVLGLRLVKKTVNQDDVSAYHLFYADKNGTPGTDITFFDWSMAGPKQVAADSITSTFFRVNSHASLNYWLQRFDSLGVEHGNIAPLGDTQAFVFYDPEGQEILLVNDNGARFEGEHWLVEEIPAEHRLKGFFAVRLSVPNILMVEDVLTNLLGWKKINEYQDIIDLQKITHVYGMDGGGPGKEVHIVEDPGLPGWTTAGSIHHVAFRVEHEDDLKWWQQRLDGVGIGNSGIVDRFYFKSVYFRITSGILFELATDGPGFAVDEPIESLGQSLALPPFLEPSRSEIEAGLKPLL